jgi:hypothetical protein
MLRDRVEELEALERFLNKPCQQVSILLQLVRVELVEFGLPLWLRKETRRCGILLLITPLVLRHFWPMVVVKVVAVGSHPLEGMGVVVVEVGRLVHVPLIPVVGGLVALVMRGHMILLRDMLAALGCVQNIMMVVEVAAVGPLLQEEIRLLQGPPSLLEVVVLV